MTRQLQKVDIADLCPGDLFKVIEVTTFHKYTLNEFGMLRTTKSLKDSYLLYLDKDNRENGVVRLNFFHHDYGIISYDIEINTSLANENNFFKKIIFAM